MSIFNQSNLDKWFDKWQSGLIVTRDQLRVRYEALMRLVWGDTPGVTIEQKFEKIGTNAAAIFQLAATLKMLLLSADPTLQLSEVPLPFNWEGGIAFNPDGSATLTARPEPDADE
jgi:hypothetical protein